MKKFIFFAFSASLIFGACNQEAEQILENTEEITSEDLTTASGINQDATELADDYLFEISENPLIGETAGLRNACPTVTLENPWGTFPNTLTLDFGPDGCSGPGGKIRSGKILIVLSDSMQLIGSTKTITFDSFFVEEVQVSGTIIITNDGTNPFGLPNATRQPDLQLTFPNGTYSTWTGTQERTMIAGGETPARYDNIYEITGTMAGVNRKGKNYTAEIIEPLIKTGTCPWFIVSGIQTMLVETKQATIDYGNGTCDKFATLTRPNGQTKTIVIHRKWWK